MNKSDEYSDIEIIDKITKGDIDLFEILIRRSNSFLYKTGRFYKYNHEDTQDLMQDTYIDAYRNLSRFEKRSSFKTWIIKIMLNNCYRKRQKFSFKNEVSGEITEQSVPLFSNSQYGNVSKIVMNKELNSIIEKALLNIPFDYRIVFSLREVNGLNSSETASILNINETNVKVRLHRAKIMLKEEVSKSYSFDEIFEFNLIYCDTIVKRVMEKINNLT